MQQKFNLCLESRERITFFQQQLFSELNNPTESIVKTNGREKEGNRTIFLRHVASWVSGRVVGGICNTSQRNTVNPSSNRTIKASQVLWRMKKYHATPTRQDLGNSKGFFWIFRRVPRPFKWESPTFPEVMRRLSPRLQLVWNQMTVTNTFQVGYGELWGFTFLND